MSGARTWLASRLAEAPEGLRRTAEAYLPARLWEDPDPARLREAALAALADALGGPTDRSGAGAVLAADALVALALGAQAARDPSGLAAFAARLRQDAGRGV